jgi:hypothetical protein
MGVIKIVEVSYCANSSETVNFANENVDIKCLN